MAIKRPAIPADNFVIIDNRWLRDPRLSWRAKGLLAYIATHAAGYRLSMDQMIAEGTDGRDSVRSAINELESVGYLRRERTRGSTGQLTGTDFILVEPTAGQPVGGLDQSKPDNDGVSAAQPTDGLAGGGCAPPKKTSPKKITEEDEPSGGSDEPKPTAQTIMKGFIDWTRARPEPLKLPGQVIGRLGRDVKQLLAEGFDERTIKHALASLVDKGLIFRPSLLQTEVVAVQQARPVSGAPAGVRKTFAEMREDHAAAKRTEAQLVDEIMAQAPHATVEQAVKLAREIIARQTVAPSTVEGYIEGVVTNVTMSLEVTS